MAKKSKKRRGVIPYRSYLFVDKDPVLGALQTAFSGSQLSYEDVHAKSDVAIGTMKGWFYGDTKRPQFATVAAVASALGITTIHIKGGKVHLG